MNNFVSKSKNIAKKIGVPGEILIPVDNIITVEDLKREVAQLKAEINKAISEKERLERESAELKNARRKNDLAQAS